MVPVGPDNGFRNRQHVGIAAVDCADKDLFGLVCHAADHRREHLGLVAEHVVECAERNACLLGDTPRRQCREPFRDKDGDGGVQQLRASRFDRSSCLLPVHHGTSHLAVCMPRIRVIQRNSSTSRLWRRDQAGCFNQVMVSGTWSGSQQALAALCQLTQRGFYNTHSHRLQGMAGDERSPPYPADRRPSRSDMITLDDVRDAARQLAGVAHRTPVVTSATLDELVGAQIFLKAENLQRIGAFKFRGAYNAISRLNDQQLARGVVAFSSGNHAQAVALSARLVGTTATIVMPQDTPVAKLEATQGYGADIVHYDRYTDDRVAVGERVAAERDLTLIHPYDDRYVMAGQGTAALELIEDVADLEMLVVCIGGGGLIAGCATAAKGVDSTIQMVGVEPEARDITRRSIEAGERLSMAVPHTIADGQQSDTPGRLTFEVNRRLLDDVVSVSDRDIVAAMRFMFDRVKLVTEPSGASALAAVMAGAVGDLAGRRVGVIVSGGNVGVERFVGLMNDPALNGPAGTSAHS